MLARGFIPSSAQPEKKRVNNRLLHVTCGVHPFMDLFIYLSILSSVSWREIRGWGGAKCMDRGDGRLHTGMKTNAWGLSHILIEVVTCPMAENPRAG